MKTLFAIFFLLGAQSVMAECTRPEAPTLPDGEVSDLQTMVAGQSEVKAYVAATEAYLDCLGAEGEAAVEEETEEAKLARIEQHNAAVDEMEAVANTFNEEIREYQAKPKPDAE